MGRFVPRSSDVPAEEVRLYSAKVVERVWEVQDGKVVLVDVLNKEGLSTRVM